MLYLTKILLIAGILLAAACHPVNREPAAAQATTGDTITLSPALAGKIKTGVVEATPYQQQVSTAGTVKVIPTKYAEITPPFAGRVTRSFLQLGMKTTPDMPLFEISSADFMTAQKTFFQEKVQLEQARKTCKRQQDLVDNGVGTQKDLEEAQTALAVAQKEYDNAQMGIRLYKADPATLVLGQPLVVRAPVAGEVIANKVILGQYIKEDAGSVATIADVSALWIAGQVKEKDIRFIHTGDECQVEVAALPGLILKGKVYHINALVDEDTRSIEVLISVMNTDHALKPGMYVTVSFSAPPVNALQIPVTALLQSSGTPVVWVAAAGGKYVKRSITTTGANGPQVIVTTGLQPGERIITEGAFYLSAIK